ncbi:hypothetical protein JL721_10211 [Aureococcus anophagefferens]|nr:hypothetical protein JL721_10211 [Aureococcus anophagefferens]
MGRALACCALALVPLVGFLLAPLGWGGSGGGADVVGQLYVDGEVWIDDATSAFDMAAVMFAEARALWASDGWHRVSSPSARVTVESRRIDAGAFARSGVLVTRGTGVIKNATADATIRLLTSPEGFFVINPMSDPKEFGEYLEDFSAGWGNADARLEVAEANAPLPPPFLPREFVVLNAMDPAERLFVSKSVLHRSRPGGSEFNDLGVPPPEGKVRALNTFAVAADDVDGGHCRVRTINFAHLGGWSSTAMMNWINCAFSPRSTTGSRRRWISWTSY